MSDPYLIPGTEVLRNKLGTLDQETHDLQSQPRSRLSALWNNRLHKPNNVSTIRL